MELDRLTRIVSLKEVDENFTERRKIICRFLTILFCHVFLFESDQLANFNYAYANYLFDLIKADDTKLIAYLDTMEKEEMSKVMEEYSNSIAMLIISSPNAEIGKEIIICIRILDYFHRSNTSRPRVSRKEFVNETVSNSINLNIVATQYYNLKNKPNKPFLILEYPWIFTTEAKVDVIQIENMCSQNQQVMSQMMSGGNFMNLFNMQNVHLTITVRRDRILEDSLSKLSNQGKNLRKPLKIVFAGEAGVDAGGVKKEFFGLLTKELFKPQYAMFAVRNVYSG